MHEHDQDIIMALAEGSLDPDTAERVAAAISACQECSADLEMQMRALAALQDTPRVYLTAAESARLHDRLHQELGVAPAKPTRAKLAPLWSRWAALAAGTAAVLLAAFLVLPSLLGGGGDDSDTVAFELTGDESSQADMERTATTAAAAEAPTAGAMTDADDGMMAMEDSATTATPETTAAPADTLAAEDGAALASRFEGDLTEELRLQIVDQLRADADYFGSNAEELIDASPEWLVCSTEVYGFDYLGLSYTPQLVGQIVDDSGRERLLVALVDNEDPTIVTLQSISIPGCEVYETLP